MTSILSGWKPCLPMLLVFWSTPVVSRPGQYRTGGKTLEPIRYLRLSYVGRFPLRSSSGLWKVAWTTLMRKYIIHNDVRDTNVAIEPRYGAHWISTEFEMLKVADVQKSRELRYQPW